MNELDLYDFDLPRERIAQHPLPIRSDSRLMLVNRQTGEIDHSHVRDLPRWLRPGDVLVLNNSRVLPARLVGYRTQTRGRWQGLFLRADSATGVWEVLTKTRGTLRPGELIMVQDRGGRDSMLLRCVARTPEGNLLVQPEARDRWSELQNDPYALLEQFGRVPLPPYIRDGQMVDSDLTDYQTVFAQAAGSVAAPTAGLHFTESLLRTIAKREVAIATVTLHVGIGTFRPIAADRLEDHKMHREFGSIDAENCKNILDHRKSGGRIVAIGTTSVRVLESAAAHGNGTLVPWSGETDLFIRPGHSFKAVDALMTNFHLPRSSLLVLVSALAGRELIMRAYQEAIREEYRFFSYGDAMLIY
ncbi:MAG: tRNA preQ1(34) S-adenosylmethionine ribosyltransferase-isomerase QueA [Planctomycetaceae bacterium]